MEHLTNFEFMLVGASIVAMCIGFKAFMRDIYSKNFKSKQE